MKRSYSRKNSRLNIRRSKRYITSQNPAYVKKIKAQQKTKDEDQAEIFRRIAHVQANNELTIKAREHHKKASEYYRRLMAAKTEQERRNIIKEEQAKTSR